MAFDVYKMVTDRIVNMIEQEQILPWDKPWLTIGGTLATNGVSHKPYSLINQLLLGADGGEWYTYKQVESLGAKVKKGEKSSTVVFYKMMEYPEKNEDGEEVVKRVPLLRYYNVFRREQTTLEPIEVNLNKDLEELPQAEDVFQDYIDRENITLEIETSNRAYYSPTNDTIHLPLKEQFVDSNSFFSVAFHESAHSTMKADRCNREADRYGKNVAFGSEEYSKEEAIAELTSSMILSTLGIENIKTIQRNASYIDSWLKQMKEDSHFLISVCAKAEKAANYILGVTEA